MLTIKLAAMVILAADLRVVTPSARPEPPRVQYVEPQKAPPDAVFDESYVLVQGLEGRLIVQPEVLQELKLQSGDTVTQDEMYRILSKNQ